MHKKGIRIREKKKRKAPSREAAADVMSIVRSPSGSTGSSYVPVGALPPPVRRSMALTVRRAVAVYTVTAASTEVVRAVSAREIGL